MKVHLNIEDILIQFNQDSIRKIIENIKIYINDEQLVEELNSIFDKISSSFFTGFRLNSLAIFRKYYKNHKIRGKNLSEYVNDFLKYVENVYNKNIFSSKHRDTRLRRISEKNKTIRFLKTNYENLLNFLSLYDKFIEIKMNSLKNDVEISKSGAGQEGTDELVQTYLKNTPGQLQEDQCHLFSYNQIKDLEKFADRLLNKFNVDVEFTKHFAERMSDDRNKPCIKLDELKTIFKKLEDNKAEKIKSHPDGEYVIQDIQKDLNLPIVIEYKKGEFDVIMKTIMRKKNFLTSNEKIRV